MTSNGQRVLNHEHSQLKDLWYRVGVCSFVHNTLGVEGHAGVPGWGLGQVTSGSTIHIDLQKPNNKLFNA